MRTTSRSNSWGWERLKELVAIFRCGKHRNAVVDCLHSSDMESISGGADREKLVFGAFLLFYIFLWKIYR